MKNLTEQVQELLTGKIVRRANYSLTRNPNRRNAYLIAQQLTQHAMLF